MFISIKHLSLKPPSPFISKVCFGIACKFGELEVIRPVTAEKCSLFQKDKINKLC